MTTHHTDDKPRKNEDEYFARQNAELINQMRAKLDSDRRTVERKEHYMKCPKCGADLKEKPYGSVTVDECTECHGVWLDAGEMEIVGHITKNPVSAFMDDFISLFSHRAKK
ncbi:MAG TPA: zf-TFIIB domain-containing protein [Sphingomicrobium sp.]